MAIAKYWTPFAFLALIPVGWWLGGGWTFLLVGALPLVLTVGDWLLGEERPAAPGGWTAHRLLPWFYIPLQLAEIVWAGAMVERPSTTLLEAVGLTLSTGVATGVFGFIAAHEMAHSRHAAERLYALAMLAGMLDLPFAISHVHGHHRRAATHADPASARRGESVYVFMLRSVAGQAREAWAFEAGRLARRGRRAFGLGNRMVLFALAEVALVAAAGFFGLHLLAFFVGQALLAIALLEAFNYIAHYGLTRQRMANGRLEPLRAIHSWSTRRRLNNRALFNMGRHADHHRFSARPYHELESLGDGAMLPCGYAGVLLLSLIPPLWRKVMDPRVDAAMGDPQAIGRTERAAA
jgi:alkane 1-monooxygenase